VNKHLYLCHPLVLSSPTLSLKFIEINRGDVAAYGLLCVRDVPCGEVCWTHTSPHWTSRTHNKRYAAT